MSVHIKIGRKYQLGLQLSIPLSNPSFRSSLEFQNVNHKYKTISALDLEQKLYRSSPIVPQCHNAACGSDNPQSAVCSQSAASVLQTSQHEFSYWNYAQAQTRQQQCSRHHTSCFHPALTGSTQYSQSPSLHCIWFKCWPTAECMRQVMPSINCVLQYEMVAVPVLTSSRYKRDEYNQKLFISAAKVLDCIKV